jgi:hypothetical protein
MLRISRDAEQILGDVSRLHQPARSLSEGLVFSCGDGGAPERTKATNVIEVISDEVKPVLPG